MPVLHKYSGRRGYYVVASFNGATVIFKLTEKGTKKFRSVGLKDWGEFRQNPSPRPVSLG